MASIDTLTTEELKAELERRAQVDVRRSAWERIAMAVHEDGGRGRMGKLSITLHIDQWRALLRGPGLPRGLGVTTTRLPKRGSLG